MAFFSTAKTAWQLLVNPKMTLAAWAQGWIRGDDMNDAPSGARLGMPYQESAWVQRAIKRVAEPIAAVPLEFYADARHGEQEIEDPRLAAFWEKPGVDRSGPMGRADFIAATVGWLKLRGESFWLLGDDWLLSRGMQSPTPMLIARPDRMRPIMEGSQLAGWEFTDAAGHRHLLLKEQVVHLKFWNPYDDLRGCSEYESARIAAESDYLAGRFALNLNRANGDRGVIVVAKGGMPTPEQQAQITASLREKSNAARAGNFRPLFLTGDVAIEDPKVSTPDANFVASRIANRHEIYIAFGVPPSMADVQASYSVGSASDRYLLIRDTCIPLANGKLADGIEDVSGRILGKPVKACFDFDEHDVMQAARRERIEGVPKLFAAGVPMVQINDVLQLGLKPFTGWDKSYLPMALQDVGAEAALPTSDQPVEDPAALPAPAEDSVTMMLRLVRAYDPIEQMKRTLQAAPPARPALRIANGDCACRFPASEEPQARGTDSARVKLWKAHMRVRVKAVKRYHAKIAKVLMSARAQVLKKIESKGPSVLGKEFLAAGLNTKAAAADFLYDPASFEHTLKAEMRKASVATLQEAGDELFAEIGDTDVFTMPPPRVQEFIRDRENRLTNVSNGIFERVKETLQDGIDDGDSTAQLAARIKAEFNAIDDGRAETIAQTEVGAAYGHARQDAMDQAGVEWKEWLTSGLANVRASHEIAEGQRVPVNDQFTVGGAKLFYPGDPQGPPGEVINCHCVSIAVADGGEGSKS